MGAKVNGRELLKNDESQIRDYRVERKETLTLLYNLYSLISSFYSIDEVNLNAHAYWLGLFAGVIAGGVMLTTPFLYVDLTGTFDPTNVTDVGFFTPETCNADVGNSVVIKYKSLPF